MKLPKVGTIIVLILGGYAAWTTVYLSLWELFPKDQTLLNRISWCTTDWMAIAAISFAIYTYSLFRKGLESNVVAQFMDFASDPANQPKLDKVLRNVLKTNAIGEALDLAVDYAKKKITASFEGQAGAQIKAFRKGLKGEFPESVQKLFENKWVENGMKAIAIIDGILKTLKEGPGVPPDQGQ